MKALIPIYVKTRTWLDSKLHNDEGATMVEYALMVALIAAVAVTAVQLLGTKVTGEFTTINGKLP